MRPSGVTVAPPLVVENIRSSTRTPLSGE